MTPYLQLRLWWRRASSGDRLAASLALALVVALAAWVLLPTNSKKSSTSLGAGATGATDVAGQANGAGGAAGGAGSGGGGAAAAAGTGSGAAVGGTGRSAGAAASGSASRAGGQAGGLANTRSPATGAPCHGTPNGAPGVTDKTISMDVAVLDLAGPIGNNAAGQASADDLTKFGQTLLADVNARGGLACRSATAKFYKVNPIGADQGRNACLQIIQDHPALAIDAGGFAFPQSAYDCIPQQKIPLVTSSLILTSEASKFAPYLATPSSDLGTDMRDTAFGLRDVGWFDPAKGFKKLGLLEDECAPEVNKQLEDALAQVGITAGQTSKYTFACPQGGFASPADMAQAESQHRAAGVTHDILLTGGGSQRSYVAAASQSGYHPQYAFTDYQGAVITAGSATGPSASDIDGALDMTSGKFGMEKTPGFPIDAPTKRCQALAVKAGLSPDMVFQGGGGICSLFWTVEAALNHAPALTPEAMLPGLFGAGPLQLAWPQADTVFKPPSKYYGGDTWWPLQFHGDCACWHILDPNRRPSYP